MAEKGIIDHREVLWQINGTIIRLMRFQVSACFLLRKVYRLPIPLRKTRQEIDNSCEIDLLELADIADILD